jgi:ribulose-5-phosphate 4-epimerase/fuculose-1-phosphate aldolase
MGTLVINTRHKVHVYDTDYFASLIAGDDVEPLPQDVLNVILKDFLFNAVTTTTETETAALAQLIDPAGAALDVPKGVLVTEEGIGYDFVTSGNIVRVSIQNGKILIEI